MAKKEAKQNIKQRTFTLEYSNSARFGREEELIKKDLIVKTKNMDLVKDHIREKCVDPVKSLGIATAPERRLLKIYTRIQTNWLS